MPITAWIMSWTMAWMMAWTMAWTKTTITITITITIAENVAGRGSAFATMTRITGVAGKPMSKPSRARTLCSCGAIYQVVSITMGVLTVTE